MKQIMGFKRHTKLKTIIGHRDEDEVPSKNI